MVGIKILNFDIVDKLCSFIKNWLSTDISHELVGLAIMVFIIGMIGILNSVDFFGFLVSLEVVMLGINFYMLTWSILLGDPNGQAFAIYILAAVVAESVIGLGILVCLYKTTGVVRFNESSTLRG